MANTGTKIKLAARMDRYRAAYKACHGRTVSVVWTGEKVRVLQHGEPSEYAIHFTPDELDAIAARMEAKVAEDAARHAVPVPDDIFEALGLPKSARESGK
jgi:hypothetical protein